MVIFLSILVSLALLSLLLFHIKEKEELKREIETLKEQHLNEVKSQRADAKKRSGAVQWGNAIENWVPFMKDFPVPPEDCHFFGKPIDFVAFTDLKDPKKCKVHLIEVKAGSSFLNGHQKAIKQAVADGRVEWHEVRVDGNTYK